jgi:hypothetical protein
LHSEYLRHLHLKTDDDLIRRHRDEHAVATLKSALTMTQAGASMDEVIARFVRQEEATAWPLDVGGQPSGTGLFA